MCYGRRTIRRAADYCDTSSRLRQCGQASRTCFEKLGIPCRAARGFRTRDGRNRLGLTAEERERLSRVTRLMEDAIPADAKHAAFIESDRPDVVLVSPLIDLGSAQTDVVKSARHLGIQTGMIM